MYRKILGEGRTGEVRTLNFVCLAITRSQAKNVSRYCRIIFRSKETTPRMHAWRERLRDGGVLRYYPSKMEAEIS